MISRFRLCNRPTTEDSEDEERVAGKSLKSYV